MDAGAAARSSGRFGRSPARAAAHRRRPHRRAPRRAAARGWHTSELTKPRIVLLIVLTGVPALLMARQAFPGTANVLGHAARIALAAGSGAAFQQYSTATSTP